MATAKKTASSQPASASHIELLNQGNIWLLRQGSTTMDITSIMLSVNYALGRATLNIRASKGK